MIIIGYQGIGKSTVANKDLKYIDLESGCFWHDGERPDEWYIYYCQIAEYLSKQGYNVFVSSHKPVRDYLKYNVKDDIIVAVIPAIELKDEWIKNLSDRYNDTESGKDYRALMNAKDRYEDNISEIIADCDDIIEITSIKYDLKDLIDNYSNNNHE